MNDVIHNVGDERRTPSPTRDGPLLWAKIALIAACVALMGFLARDILAQRRASRASAAATASDASATEAGLAAMRAQQLDADCGRAGRQAFVDADSKDRRCAGPDGRLYPAPAPTDGEKAAILPLYRKVFSDRLAAHGLPQVLQAPPTGPGAARPAAAKP